MKILYVTTVGSTMGFFKSFIRELLDEGHTVDIATNEKGSQVQSCYREWGCTVYQIDTSRSPLNKGNLNAIKQIKQLVAKEQYDLVHCHTPIAAMCTRLACRKARKKGTRVFYTAHGFHFYKGAPLKNWLIYYPVEKICAHFTDVLITINQEDYLRAQRKMRANRVEYVPGMGIDLSKFGQATISKSEKRREIGIPEDAILLLSVGELNENKNHETIIKAIADMNVYYIIAGKGDLREYLQRIIDKQDLTERVKLLGFRNDINELCLAADIFCFPSKREGLGLVSIEAMANGLPIVGSCVHGINDYLINGETGFGVVSNDVIGFRNAIEKLITDPDLRIRIGCNNKIVAKRYDVKLVNSTMRKIYEICD